MRGERRRHRARPVGRRERRARSGGRPAPARWTRITGVRLVALPDPAPARAAGPGWAATARSSWPGWTSRPRRAAGRPAWRPVPLAAGAGRRSPAGGARALRRRRTCCPSPRGAPSLDADVPRGWGVSPVYDGARAAAPPAGAGPARRRSAFPAGTRLRVRLRYGADSQGEVIGRFRLAVTGSRRAGAPWWRWTAGCGRRWTPPEPRARSRSGTSWPRPTASIAPELDGARARLAALQAERAALGVASTLVLAPPQRRPAAPATPLRRGGSFLRPGERGDRRRCRRWLRPAGGGPAIAWRWRAGWPARTTRWRRGRWSTGCGRSTSGAAWSRPSRTSGSQGARPSHPQLLDWLATRAGARRAGG